MVTYVVDTSVLTRLGQEPVLTRLTAIGTYNCRVTIASVLEMGYTARTAEEHRQIVDTLHSTFTVVITSPWAQEHAVEMQQIMAVGGEHRSARLADLLIAATALQLDATVLHYDHDFDTVAKHTGQPCEWIALPGSLDRS